MSSLEEKIEKLVEPKIVNLGYELYDVQYVKEGKDYFLRIFIDNSNGISLEDCEKVNNAITDLLDDANYIKQQYFLEVSSPGVERILRKDKHLKDNIGEKIEIKLFKPINKKKEIIGILEQINEKAIIVISDNEEQEILHRLRQQPVGGADGIPVSGCKNCRAGGAGRLGAFVPRLRHYRTEPEEEHAGSGVGNLGKGRRKPRPL